MAKDAELAEGREAWYDELIESGTVALFRTRADGTIEAITQAAAAMFGYVSVEEALADERNVRDLYVDPAQRDRFLGAVAEMGWVQGYELRMRRIDGELRWVEGDATAVNGPDGRLIAIEGSIVDRTERHRMIAILAAVRRAGERLLRAGWREDLPALLNQLGEAAEVDRAFLVGNLGSEDDRPHVIGVWQSADLPALDDSWAEQCFGDGPAAAERLRLLHEGRLDRHTADPGPCVSCVLRDEVRACVMVPVANGHTWAALGFQSRVHREWAPQEMNALRSAASMLAAAVAREEAEERHRRLVEQIPVTVYEAPFTFDEATPWTYVSPRIEELTGYTPEEWLADPNLWPDSLHEDDRERVLREEERAARHLEPLSTEYRMRRRDGTWIWVRDDAEMVADGSVVLKGVLLDVTREHEAAEATESTLELLRRTDSERRRLMRDLSNAQEAERARIADDLHDDPIQAMTAAGLRLDRLRQLIREDPEALEVLSHISTAIGSTIGRLRHMMFDLRPRSLDEGGLSEALRESLANLRSQGSITYSLSGELDHEPPAEARTTAFRIAQEALANVRKHSGASLCRVTVRTDPRGVLIEVQDDGVGFDPGEEVRSPAGHMGLSAMRGRAEGAGGWLRVLSSTDVGTTVEFLIPDPPVALDGGRGQDDALA